MTRLSIVAFVSTIAQEVSLDRSAVHQLMMTTDSQEKEQKKDPEKEEALLNTLPEKLWSKHATDVGRMASAGQVLIELRAGVNPPYRKQYPLSKEQTAGIRETISGLLEAGALEQPNSPCNTPIYSVPKHDRQMAHGA